MKKIRIRWEGFTELQGWVAMCSNITQLTDSNLTDYTDLVKISNYILQDLWSKMSLYMINKAANGQYKGSFSITKPELFALSVKKAISKEQMSEYSTALYNKTLTPIMHMVL